MKFVIIVETKRGFVKKVEWPNEILIGKIKEQFGSKGLSAFEKIIEEFKKETIKIP
jgi:hypothetical protein